MPHYMPRYQILTTYLVMAVAFVVLALYQQHQTAMVNEDSYDRCIDRAVNVNKLNTFYEAEARFWRGDLSLPADLRVQQATLYSSQVFAAPKCGHP